MKHLKRQHRFFVKCLSIFFMILLLYPTLMQADDSQNPVYVTANRLNGREFPRKTATKVAMWEKNDDLQPTGEWSKTYKWIEVYGGECEKAWVDIRYVSERTEEFVVINLWHNKVKIRKDPVNGKVVGYLRKNKELWIDQVVLGWGHCSKGWIDLSLVYEED